MMQEVVNKIKEKKELSGLDDSVVEKVVQKKLKNISMKIEDMREKQLKELVKMSRAELRFLIGGFKKTSNPEEVDFSETEIKDLLSLHSSTRERLDFYPKLKEMIAAMKIKSILDLGCGLNPLALANKSYKYYAFDINRDDINLVNKFFIYNEIDGTASVLDLREVDNLALPTADLCIILKVLDVIEKKGHKIAERIITKVNAKHFLVSFSTKTLSGKPMNHPQRGWIEQMLKRLGYSFKMIKEKNEVFYLFEKN